METIILPRGTLLFRGIRSVKDLVSDYAGINTDGSFCLYENYNVFFYPYPFIANTVSNKYSNIVFYFTRRDIKILKLISPSKYTRQDKDSNKGGVITCSKLPSKCGITGKDYDPCINYKLVDANVRGIVAIAEKDAAALQYNWNKYRPYFNKYFTTFTDARGVHGVPEIILHPRMDNTARNEKIDDFKEWYIKNKHNLNFSHLHIPENNKNKLKEDLNSLLSEEGLNLGEDEVYHAKLNKKTGFFQIVELSDDFEIAGDGLSTYYPEGELTRYKHHMLSVIETVAPEKTLDPRIILAVRRDKYYTPTGEVILGMVAPQINPKYFDLYSKDFEILLFEPDILNFNNDQYKLVYINPKNSTIEQYSAPLEQKKEAESYVQRNTTVARIEYDEDDIKKRTYIPDPKMNGLLNHIFRNSILKSGSSRLASKLTRRTSRRG